MLHRFGPGADRANWEHLIVCAHPPAVVVESVVHLWREFFRQHLGDTLPFAEMARDWGLIERLLQAGVRWEHVDRASLVFRLAEYPQWWVRPQHECAAAD